MSTPEPTGILPPTVAKQVGASLKGWNHLTLNASRVLPTDLHRANLIRRGALALLATSSHRKR